LLKDKHCNYMWELKLKTKYMNFSQIYQNNINLTIKIIFDEIQYRIDTLISCCSYNLNTYSSFYYRRFYICIFFSGTTPYCRHNFTFNYFRILVSKDFF